MMMIKILLKEETVSRRVELIPTLNCMRVFTPRWVPSATVRHRITFPSNIRNTHARLQQKKQRTYT